MTALLCFAFPCSFTWDVPRYRLHAFLAYLRVIPCWLGMREFRLYYILLSIFACIVILALQRLCAFVRFYCSAARIVLHHLNLSLRHAVSCPLT